MILEQGDVIMVDFNPSIGYEPAKIRPAVVVSGYGFNSRANLVAVVPTTTKDNGYPLHLPAKCSGRSIGFACVELLRTIDVRRRGYEYLGCADDETVRTILASIRGMLELR